MSNKPLPPLDDIHGTLASQHIQECLVAQGALGSSVREPQIQPASLDLTLSAEAYRMPGSMLPLRGESVRTELLERLKRATLDLTRPTLLDRNKTYLIRLQERLRLPANVSVYTNSKSSTGRIDINTRVVCDGTDDSVPPRYDKTCAGYVGELWLEVKPMSFDVVLQKGVSLNQAIFYTDRHVMSHDELVKLHTETPLLYDKNGAPIPVSEACVEGGVLMTLDLDQDIVGYVARKTFESVDLTAANFSHDHDMFFDPIRRPSNGFLFLERGRFYIFSTVEYVRVPPDYACEMRPFDACVGDIRAHYAGFGDPNFGVHDEGERQGQPVVLEVRAFEDDLVVRHRQPICSMAFERLSDTPTRLYSSKIGSHYADQRGPRLSKHFSQPSSDE